MVGLPPFKPGRGRLQHLGGLHIGEAVEHLQQFGQVDKAGKAAVLAQTLRIGRDLHRSTISPKTAAQPSKWSMPRSCSNSGARKRLMVYISTMVLLIGVPVAKVVPWPVLVEVAGFHEEVEGSQRSTGLDPGDPLHLGRRFQILEEMGFVDEQVIDA